MPYIDPEIIAEVKRMDLLAYLQEREPDELVRVSPGVYCTKEHDSLKISNGKWYWWSRGLGGRSALDFLIKVRGIAFLDAVEHLRADCPAAARASPPACAVASERAKRPAFRLPRRCADEAAARYLASRGISGDVVGELMARGDVYGTMRRGSPHAVFLGRDLAGAPLYAALRSCRGSYKGEAEGSDKRFSFGLPGDGRGKRLHVFEGAIDALSFATMVEIEGGEWRREAMLSLGGAAVPGAKRGEPTLPAALERRLEDSPGIAEISLHLDNDDAGRTAARAIARALEQRGVAAVVAPPPAGKDVNEFLAARYGRGPRCEAGRSR